MAALSFNSQLSSFLPREDFFSEGETSLSNNLNESGGSRSSGDQSTSPESPEPDSIPSVPPPLSQPSNDTIVNRYKALIAKRTIPGIKSIEEITNWRPETRESGIGCIFGVVKSVRDSRATKFKYVTLIDPTNDSGIEVETFGTQEKIAVGQMMKACNLKVQRTGSSKAFMFTAATKTTFFPLFSYNYDDPTSDERNKALTETRFNHPTDREICFVLEKWFSLKILNGTKLSNLPKPNEFVDICCQVVAFNSNSACMNAIIWDTTTPNLKPLFGVDGHPPAGLECINYDYYHVAYEKYFPLLVWKSDWQDQAQHFDTFKCIDLISGDDMVVLFNLQVVEDPNHPGKAALVMRSWRKWGKAVRLCHNGSILGRLFRHKCDEYRRAFRRKLGLPESSEVEKPLKYYKSPSKQTPSRPSEISNQQKSTTTNTTSQASNSQNNRKDPVDNTHQAKSTNTLENRPTIQANEDPIIERNPPEEETRQNTETTSVDKSSTAGTIQKPPEKLNVDSVQIASKRKRRAEDELLHQRYVMKSKEPVPSTSGYTLRSRRNTSTQPNVTQKQQPQAPREPTHTDPLSRLKTKAARFLSWNKLLSNGLNGLKLLCEELEEGDLRDETIPLTRDEHIQYIKFAINHLEKHQKVQNPSSSSSSSSGKNTNHREFENANDSNPDSDESTGDETFPQIDRVKYVFS